MTVQVKERLIFKGEEFEISELPLEQYLSSLTVKLKLFPPSTACWRGYIGTWEIKKDGLYLVDLIYYNESGSNGGIEYLFQGKKEVIAIWFSGEIRIPSDKLTAKPSYMYSPSDELVLEFKNGILVSENLNSE